MKNIFICGFILVLFLSGCTATMHTTIEEQFRDQSLDVELIYSDGIALLPIAGLNQTFSSVVSIAESPALLHEFGSRGELDSRCDFSAAHCFFGLITHSGRMRWITM
jgi:hypothetical protein